MERLERRLLLTNVSGSIAANTTWTLANSPYVLVGSVVVQSGATLTIEPGVTVSSPFGGVTLSTAALGALNANGVNFSGGMTSIGAGSTALLANNAFTASGTMLQIGTGSTTTLTGNLFGIGVLTVDPEFAPNLAGNTFVAGARVDVSGGVIDEAITWAKVNGLAEYRLVGNVTIQGAGAALTIAPNLTVSNDLADAGLIVTAGGALSADGVTFTALVVIQNDSTATVHFSAFAKTLTISNAAMIDISYNDFSAITPMLPRVVAMGIPSLRNVYLRNNWWGTRTPAEIDDIITDLLDDPDRPRVDVTPLLLAPPLRTDIVAAAFSVDPVAAHPLAFQPGDLVTLHFQISNNSPLANVPETRAFFSLNSTAAIPGSKTVELRIVPPIAPQTALPADTLQFTLPLANDPFWTQQPLTTPRYYTIAMRVDALGQLPEWDEPNNTRTLEIPVAANVPGTVIPGDFDFNGMVRGADLAVWAGSFGKQNPDVPLLGDAQGDRVVDGRDFLVWQRNFGLPILSTTDQNVVSVPSRVAAFTAAASVQAVPAESGSLAALSESLEPRLLPSFTLPVPGAHQRAPLSDVAIRDERLRHALFDSWRRTFEPLPPRGSSPAPSRSPVQHGDRNADIADYAFDDLTAMRALAPEFQANP